MVEEKAKTQKAEDPKPVEQPRQASIAECFKQQAASIKAENDAKTAKDRLIEKLLADHEAKAAQAAK